MSHYDTAPGTVTLPDGRTNVHAGQGGRRHVVKESPIIFSTPMILAILKSIKTQTRRVITPQPPHNVNCAHEWKDGRWEFGEEYEDGGGRMIGKPYTPRYQVGQRLWVRETWRKGITDSGIAVEYVADYHRQYLNDYPDASIDWYWLDDSPKQPSIFMPKWAARIWLEVTNVRIQRIQDISGSDVFAEGVDNGKSNPKMGIRWENMQIMAYESLWNSLNAKRGYGWIANPWVEAVTFKRITHDPTSPN